MPTINFHKPDCCRVCGHYLTTSKKYAGHRCLDPSHWQATGVLAPNDFYPMARLAALANAELYPRVRQSLQPC